MNYTLNQLQIFVKVAQTKSITRASEELNLTQPAVSIQIKNFQSQFELPLIEIVGKKVYLTDFGKEIATSAEEIIEQVYAINYKMRAFQGQLFGRLKISIVSTGKYVIPYFLSDFLKENQGVELSMDVTNRGKVIESLKKNEVDFSLVSLPIDGDQYDYMDLLGNELFLVGNPELVAQNPAYNQNQLPSNLPIIFREPGSGTRMTMEAFLENQEIHVVKKIELMSNEAVKQAVIAGLGYSIMPIIGIKNELQNGSLVIIPQKGLPITTQWKLVWNHGKKHSPVAKAFLQYVMEHKDRISQKYFK
ncbi:LysR family transcriptional regulator [Aquirufa nivalisilvae]|uniref:LysR family transcriptional regulator n=1 Tax=Aquirufa nivalisilvae TaxID=2516557 RepID=UPI00103292E1|nr:LysR family transcriptional regulator [Aquirufa nivalisilvae]TBH76333.1 LysR family transcriptional regulator [Aquirufa nivalisilvae]